MLWVLAVVCVVCKPCNGPERMGGARGTRLHCGAAFSLKVLKTGGVLRWRVLDSKPGGTARPVRGSSQAWLAMLFKAAQLLLL